MMERRGRATAFLPIFLIAAFWFGAAKCALAGPPFLTDDPEPVDYQHYEAYLFSTCDIARGSFGAQFPAFEFNWGAAPDLQLHLVAPFAFSAPSGGPDNYGFGDIELGFKYRFLQETTWRPQAGIFPMLEVPMGDSGRGMGNGRLWGKVPVWAQKSWGPWTTYGGGGYAINPAPGAEDYLFGGWLLQRELSKKLTLGGEVFGQGPTDKGGRGSAFINLGGFYNFNENQSLLFSAGRSIVGDRHVIAYLGMYWTWGGASTKRSDELARWSALQR